MPSVKLALDTERIMNILYLEDKHTLRETTTALLKNKGFSVQSAATPVEAVKFLSPKKKFNLVIVDILFDLQNSISGDEFIFKSHKFFVGIPVIAFTAYEHRIKQENRKLFHDIIQKGREEVLYAKVDEIFQQRLQDIENSIYEKEEEGQEYLLAQENLKRHQEKLIAELKSVSDPEKPLLIIGGRQFTATNLISEIEKESDIGRIQAGAILDFLKRSETKDK